jgi:hypothetical protein
MELLGTAVVSIWLGMRTRKKAQKGSLPTVKYFFYGRGRPGAEALVDELAEAHWSFMDGYAEAMMAWARGSPEPHDLDWQCSDGGPPGCPRCAGVRVP